MLEMVPAWGLILELFTLFKNLFHKQSREISQDKLQIRPSDRWIAVPGSGPFTIKNETF